MLSGRGALSAICQAWSGAGLDTAHRCCQARRLAEATGAVQRGTACNNQQTTSNCSNGVTAAAAAAGGHGTPTSLHLLPVVLLQPTIMAPVRHASRPSRHLPVFLTGAVFGAAGLAVWQYGQADSPSDGRTGGSASWGPVGALQSRWHAAAGSLPAAVTACQPPDTSHIFGMPGFRNWPSSATPQDSNCVPSAYHHSLGMRQQEPDSAARLPAFTASSGLSELVQLEETSLHDGPQLSSQEPSSHQGPGQEQGIWQLASWPWHNGSRAATGAPSPINRPMSQPGPAVPASVSLDTPATGATQAANRPSSCCSPVERPPLVPKPVTASSTSSSAGAVGADVWDQPLTRGSISSASATAAPAVVHIVVGDDLGHLQANSAARYRPSSGSGFIYDKQGYILTNAHVVQSAASPDEGLPVTANNGSNSSSSSSTSGGHNNQVAIYMHDGRRRVGHVVAIDRVSDIAVVRAVLAPGEELPVVRVGHSSQLRVGEWVVALGTPLMLKQSVTAGIVSCVERRGKELGLEGSRGAYIQTDAAINQGNSGGPLVNLDGCVVGMSVFKAVAADGVSFAIPMDMVCEVVRQLHEQGRVVRPFVGVTMAEVSNGGLKHLQQQFPQLSKAKTAVMIQVVREGSPAQDAGLQPGDILHTVDGVSGLSMSQVVEAFGRKVGSAVQLGVLRTAPESEKPMHLTLQVTPKEAS